MKLKSIEIKGFKSFYNRTKVDFPDGIVSIVGPNGSGKSNILDAFRWVLGEQSAKNLRGEKMEDVIFSGTARHGQANSCEVEVIFDNEDGGVDIEFSEISIKRKAFRSGESNYYINGKSARLKDIRELFLDSGIGKEGYSIISQGKIDEIVNSTSVQRRKLLEEASGIARFRFKKEESEKKIENSKANLERLEDIFKEIERQIEPLYWQKEKAKEYLRLSEELKTADLSLMLKEYEDINNNHSLELEEKNRILASLENVDKNLASNKEQLQEYEENLKKINDLIHNLEEEKNRLDLQKNNYSNEISRLQERMEIKREQLEKQNFQIQKQNALTKDQQETHLQITEQKKSLQLQTNQKQKELDSITQKMESLELEIRSYDEKIESITQKNKQLNEQVHKNEIRIQFLEETIQKESFRQDESSGNIHRTREKLDELSLQKSQKEKELQELEFLHDRLHKELTNAKISSDRISAEKEECKKKLDHKNLQVRDAYLKHSMHLSMEKDMDGINKSVKVVLSNKQLDGILDIVSNVIKIEEKYEKAIETALGSALQNIITDTSESAKKAIEYLKKTNSGRATFLPIENMRPSVIVLDGVVRASDVVRCDEKYRKVVDQLLGRTLLADSMDEAIRMNRKFENKYRIVTLEGELFNVGGSITGGHYYKSSNLLSRKRLIEEYQNEMNKFQAEADQISQQLDDTKRKESSIQEDISKLQTKISDNDSALHSIKLSYGDIKNRINYLTNTLESLLSDNQGSASQQKESRAQIIEITNEQKELEEELLENRYMLEDLQNERKSLADEYAYKLEENRKISIESVTLQNDLDNAAKEQQRLDEQLTNLQEQIAETKAETLALVEEISSLEKSVSDFVLQLQLCEVEFDETVYEFERMKDSLQQDNKKFESFSAEKNELESKKMLLLEEKYKIEGRMEKVSIISEKILERMREEYDLSLEDVRTMNLEANATKEKIAALRKQIQNLGNVNLDSIGDYEVLYERYETYRVQIDDLVASITELENIISKLEQDMAREFNTSFDQISKTFGTVFSKMFGGGEGKLVLSNSSDVLNSEIEIFAQPPGKKLKTISVMSGGEKALMGIALLFAIQMTKPAPFCILDEIDAALDDANIMRFNVFLKQMSDHIQFVTITHRRGTMESSDYIYGVTMQDKGISKMVSLKFEDAQEYIEQ